MKLIATKCALCGSLEDYTIVYQENFKERDVTSDMFSARKMPDRIHYRIVRCNKDGLIRSNPVLDEYTVRDLYKKSRFIYEEEAENLADSYYKALRPFLSELPKNAKILEIGCGSGFLLKRLYENGYQNTFGIEPCIDAVEKCDKSIRQHIVVDTLKPGIFKSNTFNMVYCFQTFDHIQDPNGFLEICHGLLMPGGIIAVFNHDVESLQAKILREKSPIIDIGHAYLYSRVTIRKIFEKHHFLPILIYSPVNIVSLKHLIWLSPLPEAFKIKLFNLKKRVLGLFLKQRIKIRIGNICLIAKKNRAPQTEIL